MQRPAVLVGHSLGGVITFTVAASRPELLRAAMCEDPPLYFNDQSNFERSMFSTIFPLIRDEMRRLQAAGASRDEVGAYIAAQPAPGGGTAGDHLTDESLEARVDAFLLCDTAVWDPAITGGALSGYDPDGPVSSTLPLTVLRADPAMGPAFPEEHVARLQRAVPHVSIHLVEGAPHGIHAFRSTTAAYIEHLRTVIVS